MSIINYAEKFEQAIHDKYQTKSYSEFLSTPTDKVKFVDAKTVKVPVLKLGGYGNHSRSQGFNASDYANQYKTYELTFDRDVEYFIDPMDIDETNLAVSVANLQNEFEDQVSIPERDKYRFSKLYKDFVRLGCAVEQTEITTANVLTMFDNAMMAMDEAEVPAEGRVLVVTPSINKILKSAQGIQRTLEAADKKGINRTVYSLDDVKIVVVPSGRLKTNYADTGSGQDKEYAATNSAIQIDMMLIEPSCQMSIDKYSYIKVFTPGTDSRTGDGYIYQNRKYGDTILKEVKKAGLWIHATGTMYTQAESFSAGATYFTRSGSEGSYVYTLASGVTSSNFVNGTYYTLN